jgi:hypothetical protein
MTSRPLQLLAALAAIALTAGCGGSADAQAPASSAGATPAAATQEAPSTAATTSGGAQDVAAGADEPTLVDNDIFVRVHNEEGRYSLLVPGWWRMSADGAALRVVRLDNRITVRAAETRRRTTPAQLRAMLAKQEADGAIRLVQEPRRWFVRWRNPIAYLSRMRVRTPESRTTGGELALDVVRVDFVRAERRVTLIMQTPAAVPNWDAFRLVARSFRWER